MLDSFIIERIRREKERERDAGYRPLRIERVPPQVPPERPRPTVDEDPPRGSVEIDFRL
ncbi:MAG: hypothetical protein H6732_00215 [Alphaproteobacteria bacterium]|nr:hypothetical protein [Alphaproteobacteria bacterium]